MAHQLNKGKIRDNALKALVRSKSVPAQNGTQKERQRQLQQAGSQKMAGRF